MSRSSSDSVLCVLTVTRFVEEPKHLFAFVTFHGDVKEKLRKHAIRAGIERVWWSFDVSFLVCVMALYQLQRYSHGMVRAD